MHDYTEINAYDLYVVDNSLLVYWNSCYNFGLSLHLHADYLWLHFWTDHFFFQFSKYFLPIKVVIWVCMNCLDCLDLAGLCIFFSWWRIPSMWIEVVIGILGTSYSCRFCRLFFWFHIWIRMHRALFCFKYVNCHDGVLFWKLAGACSLCLVRFVQMNLHCQCSLFRLQRWLTFLVVAVLLSLLWWWELFKISVCCHLSTSQHQQWRR